MTQTAEGSLKMIAAEGESIPGSRLEIMKGVGHFPQAEEPHRLVWAKDDSTWSWQLTPTPDGGTRLVTRLRQRYDVRSPELLVTVPLLEIGDFPMMRRMLRGIRERAEAETGAAADA